MLGRVVPDDEPPGVGKPSRWSVHADKLAVSVATATVAKTELFNESFTCPQFFLVVESKYSHWLNPAKRGTLGFLGGPIVGHGGFNAFFSFFEGLAELRQLSQETLIIDRHLLHIW